MFLVQAPVIPCNKTITEMSSLASFLGPLALRADITTVAMVQKFNE